MTNRPIRSDDLLALARSFVTQKARVGRPSGAHLRRGVSLAYYALFHELIDLATVELCGGAPTQAPVRRRASRWFAHTDMKALVEAATGSGNASSRAIASVLGQPHHDLVKVAEYFLLLQEARHQADYDHDFVVTRDEAVTLVDSSEISISRLRQLRRDGDPSLQLFLRLMVGAVRIARARQP
jgi:hypothetical protein